MSKDFKEIIENANKSFGFILSYGDAPDVIPVGVYKIDNILYSYQSPYKYEVNSKRQHVVKLVKIDNEVEEENSVMYIPFVEFEKLLQQDRSENNYMVRQLLNSEIDDETTLLYLNEVAAEYYKEHEPKKEDELNLKFYQKKALDDLNATYEVNGNVVGTNYSLVPFSYGLQKRYVKVKRKK